jgi:hypothetical protein
LSARAIRSKANRSAFSEQSSVKSRLLLTLILPDGSKSLIPADWTDLASPTQTLSAPTVTTLGSLEELLHTRAIVDALLGRLAEVLPKI